MFERVVMQRSNLCLFMWHLFSEYSLRNRSVIDNLIIPNYN